MDEQNGFRKNRSCLDHIFTLNSIIKNRQEKKLSTYCAFIDMEKAFDFLDRDLLFYRLLKYNIDGKMYKSIKSLYGKTTSCVRVNNMKSDWFGSSCGVRQGDCLSPTLFSLFINGLAQEIKLLNRGVNINEDENVSILLYADDIVLVSENEEDLQCMIDYMYEWCFKWKLKLNVEKSNIVHFRPRRKPRTEFEFHYGENHFNVVTNYKYLGILFDEFLTFETCAKVLSEAAGRALGGVIYKYRNIKDVGFRTYEKMYHAAVTSVSDYGAEIWGNKKFSFSNNVQNRAMRYYLGVHKFAPVAGMLGDFGWMSSKYRRYLCMCRYWNRMIRMDDERLVKKIFNNDYLACDKNWCSDIRDVFIKLDMGDMYHQKRVCIMQEVKLKLMNLNKQEWELEVSNKPKLRTYTLFKTELSTENYICHYMHKRNRSLLSQFRLGILPLHIETGRYTNTPLENRICKQCELNEVEDEYHFLISCPIYACYRTVLFHNVLQIIPNFHTYIDREKFIIIVQRCQKYLASYLRESFELRQSKLYL